MSDVNQNLLQALKWALEYIDSIPEDAILPAMPGFDRDYVNELVEEAEKEMERRTITTSTIYELVGKYGLEAVWDAAQTVKRGRWTD